MNDLVSIIIPAYNAENYIKECLIKICKQTYSNIEIIVINDGSTDNTLQEIKKVKDKRIRLFTTENKGVSSARNLGISKSKGKYLMFMDADDYLENNAIEILYKKIMDYDVDIIRYNGYEENKNHNFKKIEFNLENNKILSSVYDKEVIINTVFNPTDSIRCYSPLLFMKNNNIKKFNDNLVYLEDKIFYLENFLNNKKILFTNEYLYYYRFNEKSKTKDTNNFLINLKNIIDTKKYAENILKNIGFENEELLKASYGVLILYRLDYLASSVSIKEFKQVLKSLFTDAKLSETLKFNTKYLNKNKSIQYKILIKKLFSIYYLLVRVYKKIEREG